MVGIRDKFVYIISIVLIGLIFAYLFFNDNKNNNLMVVASSKSVEALDEEEIEVIAKAYISGEVINPGVYVIDDDFRILDLVNLAGGFTDEAYIETINLSEYVSDTDHIIISSIEDMELKKDDSMETEPNLININTASKEELMVLKGIGEAISLDIIAYREENGYFENIEEIKKVSGIGQSIFDDIKEYIAVN